MISMKAIREEFGGVTRLSPTVCKSEIETKKETTHYYFRSVRGKHSDLLTTSNHADDEFAVALLEQAVERLAEGRLLAPLDPANPFQFDAMLLLSPEYHGHLRGTLDDARRNLVLCVPIHRCEFTADVTPSEYRQQHFRIEVEKWSRDPFPLVMIDFHNPASKSGTGGQRIRVEPAAAWSDIRELKGVPGGFARIWNYEGEALSIHSQPGSLLRVALGDTIADRDPEHVVDLAMSFVSKGSASLNDRRSRPMPAPTEADSQ